MRKIIPIKFISPIFVCKFILLVQGVQITYCDESLAAILLNQVFHTEPIWKGGNSEIPMQMRQKFEEQKICCGMQHPNTPPISNHEIKIFQGCLPENGTQENVLKFNLMPLPSDPNHLSSAELKILTPSTWLNYPQNSYPVVRIFQVVKGHPLTSPDLHRILAVHYLSGRLSDQRLTFNVLAALQDWISNIEKNFGFLIDTSIDSNSGKIMEAILIITYQSAQRGTPAQHVPFEQTSVSINDSLQLQGNTCSRHAWNVNMTEWGLLEPGVFDLGKCLGSCYLPDLKSSITSTYTMIQSATASQNQSLTSTPCCVPATFGSMPIMYREESGNFIIKVISNLIVKSCMCL